MVGAAGCVQVQTQVAEEGLSIASLITFKQGFALACSSGAWLSVWQLLKAFPASWRCSVRSQERAPEVKLVNGVEVKRDSCSLPFKIESQILQLLPFICLLIANTPAAQAQTPM